MTKPAAQLLTLVRSHFEVAGWINYKCGSFEETIKGLEILSRSACTFNCKGGSGWSGCPVRKCCVVKGFQFCFECPEFLCERNWGEKIKHTNIFSADKIERLREMKKLGVEEWVKKQRERKQSTFAAGNMICRLENHMTRQPT